MKPAAHRVDPDQPWLTNGQRVPGEIQPLVYLSLGLFQLPV